MLFNSYEFIFAFLPLTVIVYFLIAPLGRDVAVAWLVLASLFFYGWWNPVYLGLLLLSMAVNFTIGQKLSRHPDRKGVIGACWLALGVIFNLGLIGYFKYANFAIDTANSLTGTNLYIEIIVLPLAISFYTFQQIAYLVDARHGTAAEYNVLHYSLFITFFPQLIAGPIVHHRDMIPQFMRESALHPRAADMAIGLTIFGIGLFKKVVIADGVAPYATPVFDAASQGDTLTFFSAWGGALAYTFQLYFDFSGYSDMAIGTARIFGIRLPLNFHSPYRATNIIEFWRRWHMTLSQFLRDYLYIPLGGNRGSNFARYRNLFLTMLLGGLWHGAGWTFVMWGALHGLYLTVNHLWRSTFRRSISSEAHILGLLTGWLLTFVAVVVGWVFFRASDFEAATRMLAGMAGLNGIAVPNAIAARMGDEAWSLLTSLGMSTYLGGGGNFVQTWLWIAVLLPMTLLMPNTQQLMLNAEPALRPYTGQSADELAIPRLFNQIKWQATRTWAVCAGVVAMVAVLALTRVSEFLYFQF